ncbi:unnamed protein product [Lathyrus sativus]|nr:unnamed protein product [Lathyrus sativus]
MKLLSTYADTSGQEINLNKSDMFYSRNISNAAKEDLASIMGACRMLGTGKYLGLPFMIGRRREIMIKSVLQAISPYIMSLFIIPYGVCNDIEKMLNSFWWGEGSNNRGIHWMAWDKLTCSKKEGGLGFRDFKAFNMPMVAKQANLGYNRNFVWRSIWNANYVLSLGCKWSIGDGSHVKVINEPWIKGKKEGCLSGPQKQDAGEILQVPLLEEVKKDMMIWKAEQNGSYIVRSGYRLWKSLWVRQENGGMNEDWNSL